MTTIDLKIKATQDLMKKAYNDEYVRLHNQLIELVRERKAQK